MARRCKKCRVSTRLQLKTSMISNEPHLHTKCHKWHRWWKMSSCSSVVISAATVVVGTSAGSTAGGSTAGLLAASCWSSPSPWQSHAFNGGIQQTNPESNTVHHSTVYSNITKRWLAHSFRAANLPHGNRNWKNDKERHKESYMAYGK